MMQDRLNRHLFHTKSNYNTVTNKVPSLSELRVNEIKFVSIDGILYMYYRYNNELHRVQFTKVS